jgi:hypothetical protein
VADVRRLVSWCSRRDKYRSRLTGITAAALILCTAIVSTLDDQPITGASSYDSLAFSALEWRLIGPFRGRRSVAVAGSAARPNEYYHGTTGGGVFKTTNGGLSWFPVTDAYFGGTVGAIAVSDSNPDIVYVGTGERSLRGNLSHGDGMFKSTDGGRTWSFIGLGESRHIGRVRVHPANPDVVLVAVFGHIYGPHDERGVYKTTDASPRSCPEPMSSRSCPDQQESFMTSRSQVA